MPTFTRYSGFSHIWKRPPGSSKAVLYESVSEQTLRALEEDKTDVFLILKKQNSNKQGFELATSSFQGKQFIHLATDSFG